MAEFLVECLLADALLLEQWGREDPLPAQLDSSQSTDQGPRATSTRRPPLEEGSAALERRRQLNRDSMRRTRQRTRCGIESMRATLADLAQEFDTLCEYQRSAQLEGSYATLAETSHRLKTEKFHLERVLMEYEKSRLRIAGAMDLFNNNEGSNSGSEPAAQYFEYVDITEARAQAAITNAHRCIMELEKTARPLSDWIGSVGDPTRTFGWSVKCEISSGYNFFLCMSKRVDFRPEKAWQLSWAIIMRARRQEDLGPTRHAGKIMRSDMLQVLDENMCVDGNDWHHPVKPGVLMRTIGLRFRTKTDRGFALGLSTMNPQDPLLRLSSRPVEYRDRFTWHDYEDDGDGCAVTFRSLVQYNTQENLQQRLVNMMAVYWQWEIDTRSCPDKSLMF